MVLTIIKYPKLKRKIKDSLVTTQNLIDEYEVPNY